ncbi:hypothetical protein CC78DRAFT_542199 [Lojkania enalia]|uniref:WH2 domain-containing protein n=1 Tax=Lojkania enalia TaxID=147567 RepID=A0A9P4N276_9PLEO|nr:hypothetical protein CC78DRAFT_542199 [Didymosphaeria enalia]
MPPPMGRGAGGPPPPPPMPGIKAPGSKPPSGAGRGALLSDINKGTRLKKVTQVNDRSAPQLSKVSDGPSGPPMAGAPPVPGMAKALAPPSGLAPPVPGNRARSNSDTGRDGSRDSTAMSSGAPQLGGLFAGGIPKLRKAGGVNTGADSNSPYLSDPETSRSSAPKLPRGTAPNPPGAAPPIPGGRPPVASLNPAVSALRNNLRPSSMVSTHSMPDIGSKPKPPPPIGKKPPIPPPTSRKPSGFAPPPASPARPPPVPGSAPPPPPPTHTPSAPPPPPPSSIPSAPPPPPPVSAPRPPPARSTPPPPPAPPSKAQTQDDGDEYDPYRYSNTPPRPPAAPAPPAPKSLVNLPPASLAEQAARNAFGRSSPAAPPPPPPALSPPSAPSAPAPPPPPISPPSRPTAQTPVRSMLDPSSYTLMNGGSGIKSPTSSGAGISSHAGHKGKVVPIHDLRWRFQDESQFPKPRDFTGGPKRYRAGRGSSVPLDLSAYE